MSVVQVHPDPASMELHMKVVSGHLSNAFDYLDGMESEQIYGRPSEALPQMLQAYAEPGVPVTSMPVHEAGFLRIAPR